MVIGLTVKSHIAQLMRRVVPCACFGSLGRGVSRDVTQRKAWIGESAASQYDRGTGRALAAQRNSNFARGTENGSGRRDRSGCPSDSGRDHDRRDGDDAALRARERHNGVGEKRAKRRVMQ